MPKINVKFEDNRTEVKNTIKRICLAWLHEVAGEIRSQVQRNSRVDTGDTKGSWKYIVDPDKMEAYVGSNKQNAIWEEYGTGQYALEGNGRKTQWRYKDEKGNWHTTVGKTPRRMLFKAFRKISPKARKILNERLGGL